MADEETVTPPGYVKDSTRQADQVLARVLSEHDIFKDQREKRVELLKELESKGEQGKKTAYISFFSNFGHPLSGIGTEDVPAFGDILLSIGDDVDQLNLIINSPGGDGSVAEKLIELCRSYCKEFRVIVPNMAKSAATVIALGADEIVMGYVSELGPIDAQVLIVTGGVPRQISAQSFIDSRDALEKRYKDTVKKKEDPKAILQQIAGLDAPYIDHCEKLMDFSRDVARKYLSSHMFAKIKPASKQKQAINNVLERLSAVKTFMIHGRMINGNVAKNELKLNVKLLPKDDPLWELIWHYYIRTDVFLTSFQAPKLIESRNEALYGSQPMVR